MKINKHFAGVLTLATALIFGTALSAAPTNPQHRTIEDRVRHELLGVPYVDVFDNVNFQVDQNGVVTLMGQVTRPIEKSNLEAAAKHAEGVTAVRNEIEVLPLSPFDNQIRIRTLRSLERTGSLYRYFMGTQPSIRIIVKSGHVTLDGQVLNSADRQIAMMAANRVPGVFSVTNNLQTER